MTINEIYNTFSAGSNGFCAAVVNMGVYEISRDEAERIADRAETAEEFEAIWENETFWKD